MNNLFYKKQDKYGNNMNGHFVYVNGNMSSTGRRWNKFEDSIKNKNSGTSSQSLKRNSRKIFENTICLFSGHQSVIGARATIGSSMVNNSKPYSNNIKHKAKTDMSLEDKHDFEDDIHAYQFIDDTNQIKEDMLGEDEQDEDYRFFKEVERDVKKEKSLSPNRSDIPDENQVDTVPDFFRGEIEMKNIVALNIDQITSCHTFRKKEHTHLNLNDKLNNKHFASVQSYCNNNNNNSTITSQRSQKCPNLAFTSITESENDNNEFNHNNTHEEEVDDDPLFEIRNHFFQEQLSPAHLVSRFSLSTHPLSVVSPTNSNSNYLNPFFKSGNPQHIQKVGQMIGLGGQSYSVQQSQNSKILTEDNLDNREDINSYTSLNRQTQFDHIASQNLFSHKWKHLNGIQINTQTTIDEEDLVQHLYLDGSQALQADKANKSPTQRILSPQVREITSQISSYKNVNNIPQRMKNNYFQTENVMEDEGENLCTEPREQPHQTQPPTRIAFTNSTAHNEVIKQSHSDQHIFLKNVQNVVASIKINNIEEIKNENNQIKDDPAILKDFFSYDIYNKNAQNKMINPMIKNVSGGTTSSASIPLSISQKQQQSNAILKGVNIGTNNINEEKKGYHKRRGNNSSSNNIAQYVQSNRSQSSFYNNSMSNNSNKASNVIQNNYTNVNTQQISQTNRDAKYSNQIQQQSINDPHNTNKQKLKIFHPPSSNDIMKTGESEVHNSIQFTDSYTRNQNLIQKNIKTIIQATQKTYLPLKEQPIQKERHPSSYILQTQPCESNIPKYIPSQQQQVSGKESISVMLNQRKQSKEQQIAPHKQNVVQPVFGVENKQNVTSNTFTINGQINYLPIQQSEKLSKPLQNQLVNPSKLSTIKSLSQQNFFFSKNNNQYKSTINPTQNIQNSKQQSTSKRIF